MKYKLYKKDYYKAYLLHIKPRKIYAIFGIGMICLSLFMSCLMFECKIGGWTPYLIPAGLVWVLLGIYVYPLYSINKSYKQTKDVSNGISISLEENSFLISTDKSNCKILYNDIYKLKSNKHYLLIYINQYAYIILPKENSELQELAKHIEENFAKIPLSL
jgi:hypothetical protein